MSDVLKDLYKIIEHRKANLEKGSYTCYLFNEGIDKILKKCGEETAEVIIAAKNNNKKDIIAETCDLFYHIIVLLNTCGITMEDIEQELSMRSNKTGNLKEQKQVNKNS